MTLRCGLTLGFVLLLAGCPASNGPGDSGGGGGADYSRKSTLRNIYACDVTRSLNFTTPAGRPMHQDVYSMEVSVLDEPGGVEVVYQGGRNAGCELHFTLSGTTATLAKPHTCSDGAIVSTTFKSGSFDLLHKNASLVTSFTGTLADAGSLSVVGTSSEYWDCFLDVYPGASDAGRAPQADPPTFKGLKPIAGFGTLEDSADATQLALFPSDLRIGRLDDQLYVLSRASVYKINPDTLASTRIILPAAQRGGGPLPAGFEVSDLDVAANGDLLLALTDGSTNQIGWLRANGTWTSAWTGPQPEGHAIFRVRAGPNDSYLWTEGATLHTSVQNVFDAPFESTVCPTPMVKQGHYCIGSLELDAVPEPGGALLVHFALNAMEGNGGQAHVVKGLMPDGGQLAVSTNGNYVEASGGAVVRQLTYNTSENLLLFGCGNCTYTDPPAYTPGQAGDYLETNLSRGPNLVQDQPAHSASLVMTRSGKIFSYTVVWNYSFLPAVNMGLGSHGVGLYGP